MRFNRIIYAIVLLLLLILAFLYNEPVAYTALYAFILIPIISLIAAIRIRQSFKLTQRLDRALLVKGDDALYELEIKNRGIFYYPQVRLFFFNEHKDVIILGEDFIEETPVEIFSRQSLKISFHLNCLYRGRYRFGLKKIELFDSLGLFRFSQLIPETEHLNIIVYPLVKELDDFPFSSVKLTEVNSSFELKDEDYATISDLRKYQPTDSFKKIHWKLSAKKNELMVKNYQNNALSTSLFFIDTNKTLDNVLEAIKIEDELCEHLVSAMNFCAVRGFPIELVYKNGGYIHELDGKEGFDKLFEAAAQMSFDSEHDFVSLIDSRVFLLKGETNIITVCHSLNEPLCEQLMNVARLGHNVVLIYRSPLASEYERMLIKNLKEANIFCV